MGALFACQALDVEQTQGSAIMGAQAPFLPFILTFRDETYTSAPSVGGKTEAEQLNALRPDNLFQNAFAPNNADAKPLLFCKEEFTPRKNSGGRRRNAVVHESF